MTQITYARLRERGFRLHSTDCSHVPHMVVCLNRRSETALEVGPYHADERTWCVWLRSDMAHSRCRFCFVREATSMDELDILFSAITGDPLPDEEIDAEQFAAMLAREREDCQRRYAEYCKNERWSYVPG